MATPDGFGYDVTLAVAEGGLVGTLSAVGLTALSTLPVVLIAAPFAIPVGVVVGVVTAVQGIRKAYKGIQ